MSSPPREGTLNAGLEVSRNRLSDLDERRSPAKLVHAVAGDRDEAGEVRARVGTLVRAGVDARVAALPFRRSDVALAGSIRAETEEEGEERERIRRGTHAGEGWYKRHARAAR